MSQDTSESDAEVKQALKTLSSQDFKSFGLHHIAYIRPKKSEAGIEYVIYGADGTKVSASQNLNEAKIEAKNKNLEPVIVH